MRVNFIRVDTITSIPFLCDHFNRNPNHAICQFLSFYIVNANVESAIFPWLNFIPIFLIGFRPAIEHNKLVIFQFNYHLYRSSVDLTLIQYTAHIFADSHLRNIHRFNLNVIPV